MYVLLLISKYLRRKLAPLFACLAVVLCTAMVIIVMSVMGGFLEMLRDSAHRLSGDVIVQAGSITGFEHYEDLIDRLEATGEVDVATPVIDVPGLVKIRSRSIPVAQVVGIEPGGYDAVVGYAETMYWSDDHRLAAHDRAYGPVDEQSDAAREARDHIAEQDFQQYGRELTVPPLWRQRPEEDQPVAGAIVPGIEVSPYNARDGMGEYAFSGSLVYWGDRVVLTVLPLTQAGGLLEPQTRAFAAVNEFKSGLYEVDANRVYVPLDLLQQMLGMDPAMEVDADGLPTGNTVPARVTEVLIKGVDGVPLAELKDAVDATVAQWEQAHGTSVFTMTWEQRHGVLLSAVENERGLVTFLFAVISVVAVVMVATTFYMIVLEKTRDIGTLRAIGASATGIAGVFLGYGLAVGLIGAGVGTLIAYGVVTNLNGIQEVLDAVFGWRMWNPQTYYFDRIPDRVAWIDVTGVAVGAILSSVAGALIPAILAARQDPVETLRYE